jgi:hypothetical protein
MDAYLRAAQVGLQDAAGVLSSSLQVILYYDIFLTTKLFNEPSSPPGEQVLVLPQMEKLHFNPKKEL